MGRPAKPKIAPDDAAGWRREARKLRKALERSTNNALVFGARLDAIMKLPSTPERGSKIAKLMNELDMANDGIRFDELGVDYRTDKKAVIEKLRKAQKG